MAGRRNRGGREAEGARKVAFEARVPDAAAYPLLDAVADLFGRVQRRLWADSQRTGREPASFKREYLPRFGLTGRHFNSIAIDLKGRVAAAKASQKRHLSTLGTMIENLKVRIARGAERLNATRRRKRHHIHDEGTKRQDQAFRLHHINRRLASLSDRRARVEADAAAGRVRLSFGGRRLFRHQFALGKSGFRSHDEWRRAWRRARSSQFLCVGAGEETGGNQTCTLLPDGRLRLRLPNALAARNGGGKYLLLDGIAFTRGSGKRKHPVPDIQAAIAAGWPVAYRFIRRERKGRDAWYVQATVDVLPASVVTDARLGAIGVDINPAHVEAAELDRCGNPLAGPHHPDPRRRPQPRAGQGFTLRGRGRPRGAGEVHGQAPGCRAAGLSRREEGVALPQSAAGQAPVVVCLRRLRPDAALPRRPRGCGGYRGQPGLHVGYRLRQVWPRLRPVAPPGGGGGHRSPGSWVWGAAPVQNRPFPTREESGKARLERLEPPIPEAARGTNRWRDHWVRRVRSASL